MLDELDQKDDELTNIKTQRDDAILELRRKEEEVNQLRAKIDASDRGASHLRSENLKLADEITSLKEEIQRLDNLLQN